MEQLRLVVYGLGLTIAGCFITCEKSCYRVNCGECTAPAAGRRRSAPRVRHWRAGAQTNGCFWASRRRPRYTRHWRVADVTKWPQRDCLLTARNGVSDSRILTFRRSISHLRSPSMDHMVLHAVLQALCVRLLCLLSVTAPVVQRPLYPERAITCLAVVSKSDRPFTSHWSTS